MNTFIVEYKGKENGVTSLFVEDTRSIEQLTQHLESGFSHAVVFKMVDGGCVLLRWSEIVAIYEYDNLEEK